MPATKTRRGVLASSARRALAGSRSSRRAATRAEEGHQRPSPVSVARSRAAAGRAARRAPGRRAGGRPLRARGRSSPSGCGPTSPGRWASALADGTGAVLGRARVAVPVACFAFGVRAALAAPGAGRRSPTPRPPRSRTPPAERPTVRIAIGALLLFVADVGILHLAYGRPSLERRPRRAARRRWCARRHGRRPARSPPPAWSAPRSSSAASRWSGCCSRSASRSAMIVSAATSRSPHGRGEGAGVGAAGAGSARARPPSPTIRRHHRVGPAPFDYAAYEAEPRARAGAGARAARSRTPSCSRPWPDAAIEIPTSEDPSGQLVIDLGDDAAGQARPVEAAAGQRC